MADKVVMPADDQELGRIAKDILYEDERGEDPGSNDGQDLAEAYLNWTTRVTWENHDDYRCMRKGRRIARDIQESGYDRHAVVRLAEITDYLLGLIYDQEEEGEEDDEDED
jgi:hypothetical protein